MMMESLRIDTKMIEARMPLEEFRAKLDEQYQLHSSAC